jgi:hypothetical protein
MAKRKFSAFYSNRTPVLLPILIDQLSDCQVAKNDFGSCTWLFNVFWCGRCQSCLHRDFTFPLYHECRGIDTSHIFWKGVNARRRNWSSRLSGEHFCFMFGTNLVRYALFWHSFHVVFLSTSRHVLRSLWQRPRPVHFLFIIRHCI